MTQIFHLEVYLMLSFDFFAQSTYIECIKYVNTEAQTYHGHTFKLSCFLYLMRCMYVVSIFVYINLFIVHISLVYSKLVSFKMPL